MDNKLVNVGKRHLLTLKEELLGWRREFLKDHPRDWSALIFSFIILAHTNIQTHFSDDTKLLDFVNVKMSGNNLGITKDLDDLESWNNGNGI